MTRKVSQVVFILLALLSCWAGVCLPTASAQSTKVTATQTASAAAPSKQEDQKDETEEYRHSPTVTKLGSMVGMTAEQASVAFTILNLVILLAGVGYLLLKNLPKSFKNRNAGIQKQIVDARAATQDAKARLSSVEERLSKLDEQIASMRAQAEADGAREEERLKSAIEEEKTRILSSAGLEIQSATLNARRELQKYAAELAIDQAARKLVVTPEADRFLVEGFAERLKAFGKDNY